MTDESGQAYPATVNSLFDNAVGTNGYYGFFTANMHTTTRRRDRGAVRRLISAARLTTCR